MNAQEITNKIENGQYIIEYNEECNCYFDWRVVTRHRETVLDDGADSTECWDGNALYVPDENGKRELVAEYIRYDGWKIYIDGLDADDLPGNVYREMLLSEVLERGESDNDAHASRRRDALVEFLMEGNYQLGRDDERGFANEYTMTLRPATPPIEVTREAAEKWADGYLYDGDAATEAFVGFQVLDDEDDDEQ